MTARNDSTTAVQAAVVAGKQHLSVADRQCGYNVAIIDEFCSIAAVVELITGVEGFHKILRRSMKHFQQEYIMLSSPH